mmetsp:Transcript_26656/g.62613  ORF Transcript_26656/g.62613 Transcript_26656/m.62613 type:complete len:89 (-) Transcript_26656:1019-1285(-)
MYPSSSKKAAMPVNRGFGNIPLTCTAPVAEKASGDVAAGEEDDEIRCDDGHCRKKSSFLRSYASCPLVEGFPEPKRNNTVSREIFMPL